jgi:hypothetical protein
MAGRSDGTQVQAFAGRASDASAMQVARAMATPFCQVDPRIGAT